MSRTFLLASAVLFTALASTSAAQESPPARNLEMQEMMKLMMPGDGHKPFAKMAGKWTTKMKIWNSATPAAPPTESTGEVECKLIFGGRFVEAEATGTVMRMPMQRVSILGYDNFTKVYTQVFFSSLETSTNIATGTLSADGKALTLRGEFNTPQGKYGFKNVIRFESDDVQVFESYRAMPNGTEMKVIEEISSRVKN